MHICTYRLRDRFLSKHLIRIPTARALRQSLDRSLFVHGSSLDFNIYGSLEKKEAESRGSRNTSSDLKWYANQRHERSEPS